jgi:hypothetical protein
METLWQDLRYGARLLRLSPGFTAVAILSLALGIGANTAIFQLVDAVRLRTLPVKNPQELAVVRIADRKWSSGRHEGRYSQLTNPMWEQIRDHQQGFSSIFAWAADDFNLATGGQARHAQGMYVSGDFFKVLEAQPLLGRLLTSDDDRRGCGAPGAVISYAFWQVNLAANRLPSAASSLSKAIRFPLSVSPRPASSALRSGAPTTSPCPYALSRSSAVRIVCSTCATAGGSPLWVA